MKKIIWLIICFLLLILSCQKHQTEQIDLSGEWQFQMDPEDRGVNERWFDKDLPETIQLPGSMAENGKGNDITLQTKWTGGIKNPEWFNDPSYAPYADSTNVRFPYWLQPEKEYVGAAWYRKEISIPVDWKDKTILLTLERPHWESTVWVNGMRVGMQNSLAVPHRFDISSFLKTGNNTLTVCVDNRTKAIDVGENSHSISDHTQSNWNGIVGEISLKAAGKILFDHVEVFPNVADKTVKIKAKVHNLLSDTKHIKLSTNARLKKNNEKIKGQTWNFEISPGENDMEMIYNLGENALFWDEFNPNVYELLLTLNADKETDSHVVDFGLREFKREDSRFVINGRPLFLRGTLECAIFPKTGYPPIDIEYWEKIYRTIQAHGLNHIRFHSWCPPEVAFEAADEMGVYLQVECSSWANQSTQLGSGLPVDQYIWDESERIIKNYGNHPSFVMMAYGNEPGGPKHREFLTDFVSYWKEKDNRRVYTSAAGWPVLSVNDYHNIPEPRIQRWAEELRSIINSEAPRTDYDWSQKIPKDGIPVVSHEIGQWCVYPNFKEMGKYTGVLKPKNFEIFRASLQAHGMEHLADSFLLASGKLQALCYKADIEAALRTPGFAGFQLLDLHDFPGQGTALVGVLDPFWEEKGYVSPEEYSRFCNATVPLVRLGKRIFIEGETMTANIEVAHFGEKPLQSISPKWQLTENGEIISEGMLALQDIPIGNAIQLGEVTHRFEKKGKPRKLNFKISIAKFENSWDMWVYPTNQKVEFADIKVVENINRSTLDYLLNGGKVLLSLGKGKVSPEMGGNVGVGFSSIFWNTAWTGNQKPHILGILCDPAHPALENFPTEYHSNWQWWDAMSHGDAILLDSLAADLKPIVRIIDDWVTNRNLGLIFEAQVGKGRIVVSGTDLVNNLTSRPEAIQLRTSLLQYMKSETFKPGTDIEPDILAKVVR
ncbi:MAG: beta-galactosidase [Bacteroidetes bacterium GWD2_45_23]|nr:MAG: beta-galactosidase [Bacteroidetes bacterium GWC2_46_850]OFX74907.1 MAG: beta-galactosidase [Bacteroidetes bacterium GWC1_47_7]OFX86228.1 MAG: beta-galactosidase [Bacteroidetes bacterium GWD2_45_23]HAR37934.1 beta-galactosidase [Porphyromonadaceae bacterium]HCC17364.1 beta-galactosidase [Porphyromonadaceae bacterium]